MPTFTGFDVSFRTSSLKVAASAEISSIFEGHAESEGIAIMFDALLNTDFYKPVTIDSFQYIRKKGVGLRICVRAFNLDTSVALSFPGIIAQSNLRDVNIYYRVEGIQLPPNIILELLTVGREGDLTKEVYIGLLQTIGKSFPEYLRSTNVTVNEYLVPLPSHQEDPKSRARSINYGISKIAQRVSLKDASSQKPADISEEILTLIYAKFLGSVSTNSEVRPSPNQATSASLWLSQGIKP